MEGKETIKPTNGKYTYGYWRTDKPREEGFSHEFISNDAAGFINKTDATIDTLDGLQYPGVDTLLKAFKKNVAEMPTHPWLGTRVGDDYEWVTLKEVDDIITNLSYGFHALGLIPEIQAEGETW